MIKKSYIKQDKVIYSYMIKYKAIFIKNLYNYLYSNASENG